MTWTLEGFTINVLDGHHVTACREFTGYPELQWLRRASLDVVGRHREAGVTM